MRLDDAIVYYSETAKECRRKARIESNDYMDMKDSAYEAEQLADWLNELKVLRERIDAQPTIEERKNCETCRYNSLEWDEEPCDSCTGDHWKPERKTEWIPIKWHDCTDADREKYGFSDDIVAVFDCEMPDDDQAILVTTSHGYVNQDVCYIDDGYSLDSGWDWIDDITAWMPLPKPYEGGNDA